MKKSQLILFGLFFILPKFVFAAEPIRPMITKVDELNQIISGLTPHGYQVIVYVDDKFLGTAQTNNSDTETDNFYFSYKNILTEGEHHASVFTRDQENLLLSASSDGVEFNVKKVIENKPAISAEAVSEKLNTEINEESINVQLSDKAATDNYPLTEKNKKILIWNLSVFIFFLCAVIGWIVWVNKELRKEKEAVEKEKN